MEYFTISAGISVHVWDTKDERCPVKPGMTNNVKPGMTESVTPGTDRGSLVLLHGYLETMYIYTELVEALKPHCRVIVIDMPGHGLTDSAPADAEGKRVNTLAFCADVVAGVLDKCGVEKAVVAGHSMGGYVTLKFLQDHPDRVERAVLLHSNPWADAPEKAADRAREEAFIAEGKLMSLACASIPRMYYEENLEACAEKIHETVELCEMHDPEGIIASIEGLRTRPDLQSVMAQPPVPLMLVYGDHDNFLPLARVDELKKLFPKVTYQLIPETGHNSFIERPDSTLAALIQWVAPQS